MILDPANLALMIPIVAISMGIGSKMLQSYLEHRREMAALQASSQSSTPIESNNEIARLSAEMARLRDTTTQYDLSIQHALDDIQRRLLSLETANGNHRSSIQAMPDQQHVNINS